ncbi:ribulokinase [Pseudoflavitalea rhizosphaerae]|uniref:ribulokinase n=1 Tax=Pseudoflavitalea rhizosphaerae TaxID=1884793 RepID=UPI000F8D48A9|nr:ribulokinase [Pseudoflavitalea rhizosphaerae]
MTLNKEIKNYVIGVDYGTDSVRAILVDAGNGKELSSSVFAYPRWKQQLYCNASRQQYRQHPLDYMEGLEFVVKDCLEQAGAAAAAQVRAISVDTTGSTPVVVNREGIPLSLLPGFEEHPNAMFVLWKDHSAIREAADINRHPEAAKYLQYCGGIYSSEWFWAKWLYLLRNDEQIRAEGYSLVEHCDWMPFLLTGGKDVHALKRSICAAGHKALWSESFGGLPPNSFFAEIDPLLDGLTDHLFTTTYTSDVPAGTLCADWAGRLGLSTDVIIGIGAFDAHMGAVGGQIEPYYLSKVMGTSTCDMLAIPEDEMQDVVVKGICGQVPGSVIPGMTGLEAGQSAFGDTYAWFSNLVNRSITELSGAAAALPLGENDEIAVDWLNGRRTPDANQELKATISNLDLGSDAVRIFKALVEATCFGARAIVERFVSEGVPIKGLIGLGGVARKSPYIMQLMADVTGMPIRIHRSEQTCAAGAAMFAAVVAKIHPTAEAAMEAMGQGFEHTYHPRTELTAYYAARYQRYQALGAQSIKRKKVNDRFQAIREQAWETNMQLPAAGLVVATFGNVSAADQSAGLFAIKPSGVPYDQLSPAKMVIVDFDGRVIEGSLRPSSDTLTHAVLYKHWPQVAGICHTHSTYATAWAQALKDIPLFGTTHADHCTTAVPCAAPMRDELIKGDYEYSTGFQIMECLLERGLDHREIEMVLVGNHAPFTWGRDAAKAIYNSIVLEQMAKMALLTLQINSQSGQMKDALIQKHFERKHGPHSYYGQ